MKISYDAEGGNKEASIRKEELLIGAEVIQNYN